MLHGPGGLLGIGVIFFLSGLEFFSGPICGGPDHGRPIGRLLYGRLVCGRLVYGGLTILPTFWLSCYISWMNPSPEKANISLFYLGKVHLIRVLCVLD